MKNKTKVFKIIVCTLLSFTILWSVLCGIALILGCKHLVLTADYDFFVAGVPVRPNNASNILGDGTVYYDVNNNILTFENAAIESEQWGVYSKTDLNIQLIGKNKIVCTNEEYSGGIYAGDNYISKDLAFIGEGSLTIEFPKKSGEAVGIFADELTVTTDITVITADCENKINGIVCSSLVMANKGTATVNNGASKNSVGVRVRGNALFEEGTMLDITVNPGTTEICKGFSVSGDIFLGKDTSLAVSVDDALTDLGECIRVSGLIEIGNGSNVTASAKNTHAIECFGTIEANKDATISAVSDKKIDIFCSGAVLNYGATVNAETDAIGGIHNKTEN